MHLLPKDSNVVVINDVYGGTYRFFRKCAAPLGFGVLDVELSSDDFEETKAALQSAINCNTSLLWLESPTNPTLKICRIGPIVDYAKKLNPNIIVVVDNTFLTSYYQRPLDLGADIVVHSVSKYINGHSDVVMGIACTNIPELGHQLKVLQNSLGTIPDPHACWLACRGLQTFVIRMERISENALTIAQSLAAPAYSCWIKQVIYPGLKGHIGHEYLIEQQRLQGVKKIGFSGMIGIVLQTDDTDIVKKFAGACKIFTLAESLGGVESLLEVPALMTHASVAEEDRLKVGITNSLVRLSVGIENCHDLLADLVQAFHAVF